MRAVECSTRALRRMVCIGFVGKGEVTDPHNGLAWPCPMGDNGGMAKKPGKDKEKQEEFEKCYVKIWQQIIEILKTDSAVRAHVHYMPQLQLIRELDIYIDPEVQADVFGQSGKLSAYFLMTFFNLRNEEAKKQVKELLKIKRQCDLSPEEKIEL